MEFSIYGLTLWEKFYILEIEISIVIGGTAEVSNNIGKHGTYQYISGSSDTFTTHYSKSVPRN